MAFLRGIMPSDPRMKNDKLRAVFGSLGFFEVQSVISSGNIIFFAKAPPSEAQIENAIHTQLGFFSTTIVRSQDDIAHLLRVAPFGDREHSSTSYLLVTFLKNKPAQLPFELPYQSPDGAYHVVGYDETVRAIFTVTNPTAIKTPDVMRWLEKQCGKDISSRTWKTVMKIHDKM